MTLHVGIDEAGYGPRLGPMVVGAVGFGARKRPDWEEFAPRISRVGRGGDILVDDSKRVHRGPGSGRLEACVGPFLRAFGCRGETVHALLAELMDEETLRNLSSVPWYGEDRPLGPLGGPVVERALASARVEPCFLGVRILTAGELNGYFSSGDNKAQAEWRATGSLLERALSAGATEIVVDRMGGRKDYRALLGGLRSPDAVRERSRGEYELALDGRTARVSFRTRADASDFCTSLASMICKYVRELLMERLNSFFAALLPGLRPTAGYPRDAGRFLGETRNLRSRLGLSEESFVRRR